MRALAFDPAQIDVRPGDTITWINRDVVPHTTTIQDVVDSGEIAAGGTHTTVVEWGENVEVTCSYHPVMKAMVTVTTDEP